MTLLGLDRIRDQFGLVYDVEILSVEDTPISGRCIRAHAKPADTIGPLEPVGLFQVDRVEFLTPAAVA